MKLALVTLAITTSVLAGTVTSASISGFGTTTVTGMAIAGYLPCGNGPCSDPSHVSISADATGLTLGPERDGFIEMFVDGGGEQGGGEAVVDGYEVACGELCSPISSAPQPFTLGVPFQIHVDAGASLLGLSRGGGEVLVRFSLFESFTSGSVKVPTDEVIIYDASSVPEPSTLATALMGLLIIGLKVGYQHGSSASRQNRPLEVCEK